MKKELIAKLHRNFGTIANEKNGIEYWLARELQTLLGYSEWRNFLLAVEKAKNACLNTGLHPKDHFVDVNKMVQLGSGSTRSIDDIMLSRYACYLIAQNGDPRKEAIAFAQSYFAIQTRKQEIIEQRIADGERLRAREKLISTETELSGLIYERGVDGHGFGRIRSKGDQALFGGLNTLEMKRKYSTPRKRALADFLPTITIKAKDFAAELTNYNVRKNNLRDEPPITKEHVKNNQDVRTLLSQNNIHPEDLPSEDDIKTVKHQVKTDNKVLLKKHRNSANNEEKTNARSS